MKKTFVLVSILSCFSLLARAGSIEVAIGSIMTLGEKYPFVGSCLYFFLFMFLFRK